MLLTRADIQLALQQATAERMQRLEVVADAIIEELSAVSRRAAPTTCGPDSRPLPLVSHTRGAHVLHATEPHDSPPWLRRCLEQPSNGARCSQVSDLDTVHGPVAAEAGSFDCSNGAGPLGADAVRFALVDRRVRSISRACGRSRCPMDLAMDLVAGRRPREQD